MKANRVHQTGGPDVMRTEDVPDPMAEPGQVVVLIHGAGVNPVNTYIRSADQGRQPALPYTPGSGGAGVAIAVGSGVSGIPAGGRVYLSGTASGAHAGTYAEQARFLPEHLHPLPEGVSFARGTAVNVPYATAYRALVDRARA